MCEGVIPVTIRPPNTLNLATTLPTVRMVVDVSKASAVLSTALIIRVLRSKVRHTVYYSTHSQHLCSYTRCQRKTMKSARRRCKHCALAVVRRSLKFSPRRRPLPRGTGRPKFNQLEMVTTFTYKPSLVRIDVCNFELSW